MKTYHMYHTESISAESKLKEFEKQEERQIGRTGDPVFNMRLEDKTPRRSFVKKIEKMKEKVQNNIQTIGFSSDIFQRNTKAESVLPAWRVKAFTDVIPAFYAWDLF